jgi:hypothetical protein
MSEQTAEPRNAGRTEPQVWFERELGGEWVSDGDGVYHHVADGRPAPDEVDELLDPADP